jgi:hypothetical protein
MAAPVSTLLVEVHNVNLLETMAAGVSTVEFHESIPNSFCVR